MFIQKQIMEQNLIYYIDQYLNNQFISRSEPYYDRETCEHMFSELCDNSCEDMYYRINVSMPLTDYENLVLASQKIRIRFIEREEPPTEDCLIEEEPVIEDENVTEDENVNYRQIDSYFIPEENDFYTSEEEEEPLPPPPEKRKAYKTKGGYVIYNNKKNRIFLLTSGWDDFFNATSSKKLLFIKKKNIKKYELNFFEYFKSVKMTTKVTNLLNIES